MHEDGERGGLADGIGEAAGMAMESGVVVAFERYGVPHLAVLVLTVGAIVVMVAVARIARRSGGARCGRAVRWQEGGLVAALVLTYPAKLAVMLTAEGSGWDYRLPLHLCDVAAMVAALALLMGSRRLGELAYFWGLAGTVQGLLTPALAMEYPHPEFFRFFLLHSSVVVAACYLPLGKGLIPERGAPWRAFGWLQVYMVAALAANVSFDSNYGFLMRKPASGSLLDHLGDWPWYLLALQGVALGTFWLLYLPWMGRERKPGAGGGGPDLAAGDPARRPGASVPGASVAPTRSARRSG
ncbi:hypothetical protein BH23VER1_BH23VER1_37040 [soil metagenome]